MPKQFLYGLEVHTSGIQRRGAEVAQRVWSKSPGPLGSHRPTPSPGRLAGTRHRPSASPREGVTPFARQERGIGIGVVITELVANVDEPPFEKVRRFVDRRHQAGLGTSARAALAEAHMNLAVLPRSRTPVSDIEHERLAIRKPNRRHNDAPDSPGRPQELAGVGQHDRHARRASRPPPRRAAPVPRRSRPCRAVELVDWLDDDVAGEGVKVTLITLDQEVEEPGQAPSLLLYGQVATPRDRR